MIRYGFEDLLLRYELCTSKACYLDSSLTGNADYAYAFLRCRRSLDADHEMTQPNTPTIVPSYLDFFTSSSLPLNPTFIISSIAWAAEVT